MLILVLATVNNAISQTTANFNSGYSDGNTFADGTTYNGLKFETENDLGIYYDGSGIGNSGSACLYPNSSNPGDITWMSITKSDNSNFKFVSVWTGSNIGDASMDIFGYLNGTAVDSSKSVSISSDGTHTLNWNQVDSIVFTASTDLLVCFDNFIYDDEVVPNATPSISIDGSDLAYTENESAKQVDDAATLTDSDGDADWDGGTLTAQITSNAEAADQLSIPDNIVGTINTDGLDLRDNSTVIGTLSASEGTVTNNTTLTITFNSSATDALVQQTLRAISYLSTSEDPGTSDRTVTFTATDNNAASANDARTIAVSKADNDAPTIATNSTLTLDEGDTETITNGSHLSSTDIDDTDATLTFTITAAPQNGQVENTDNSGVAISSFTEQNLIDGKIQYVHDGSNTTSDDFTFKVADDGGNELTGQTFNFTITAVDDDTPTITTNKDLSLNEGATAGIPIDSLEANDADTDNSTLTYTITAALSNGQLENTDNPGVAISSFTQQNLTDDKIQYVHDGSNTTSDSFTFKVADGTPNELTGQTYSITVVAVDDDTPTISTNKSLSLNEGATAGIPIDSLEANDADTDNSTLTYTITAALSNGQLENTDNPSVAISSFTQQNLTDDKIQYVHDGSNTTSDSFTFKVADGTPNELTGQTYSITVVAVDDDTPTISTNKSLSLNEGATAGIPIDSLEANDADTDNSTLTYTITAALSNGQLENTDNPGVSISSFTQQNLTDDKIQYVHDGSNTTSDSFTFKVADGTPNELTGQTYSITVVAVDDDTPTISTNKSLSLNEGATAGIPIDSLEANDADTDNSTLTYTITAALSNGQLENTDNPGVAISSFTQQNLTDDKIQYVHDGSNTTSDSFTFKVADGTPNELTGQTYSITVVAVDDDTPTISTNKSLSLNEGATAGIPIDSLEANDADTDNSTLTYTITAALSNGQLENTDNPGVAISSFTQQNLTDDKIQYVHDGSNTTSDSFTFKVADGTPNELTGQTYSITVVAVDDDTPTISTNKSLSLNEGATAGIPIDSLEANDADTDNSTLTYTITAALSNGQLENTDNPGVAISSFTQQNLTDDKIQYVHDGSNTTSDSFTFKVADGTPNELTGQTYSITVVAVDDDTPTISTNKSLSLNEGATAGIPIDSLEANDADTDNSTLTYTITAALSNGQLENTDNPGVSISSFTQQNLTDDKIQYVHDGSNTTSDSFTFKVADGTPNELTGQTYSITVVAVDDDTPTISTNKSLSLNEGATAGIPIDSLEANDTDTDNSTLTYTVTVAPSNGQLENTDNPGVSISSFTQQNLTDDKIQYVHDGSNTTSDSFTFKVADAVPNELTGQTYSIDIVAVDDETPTISTNKGLKLLKGNTVGIPVDSLAANDADTDNSTLIYSITASTSNGQIENADNPGTAITTFTHQNLIDGKIQYVHNGSLTTSDSFTFKVADGASNEITGQTFSITIIAADESAPTIATNRGLRLNEGATAIIPIDSLAATDTEADNSTLIYTITASTSNGRIENTDNPGTAITTFTQQNLIDGKIQYVHDGSNTTSDSFTFKVADAVPNELTGQTYSITVVAVDDTSPAISVNKGLKLLKGETVSIPVDSLAANDADTDNSTLIYSITASTSNGQIENADNPGTAITTFTHQNLIDGKIQYVHNGSLTTSDSFTFKVADGASNEITGQTFSITIIAADESAPTIATNKSLSLNEGATAKIPIDSLAATDTEADNATLTFTITSSTSNGRLESTDSSGVAITTFTQQDLIDGKIQYVHDGSNTTSDSFTFKVADAAPNELTGQKYNIDIVAVDDDTPTISTNKGLKLLKGESANITAGLLSATDSDTDDENLIYTITASASHGQIENIDNPGVAITTFTQKKLIDEKIQYVHDNSITTSDSFIFKVSDAVPNELTNQTFSITILGNNTVPEGADDEVTINEDESFTFSTGDFSFSDADSGAVLTGIQIITVETAGTLKYNDEDITDNAIIADLTKLVFRPDSNMNGTNYATFTFKVFDGLQYSASTYTMTINVTPVNDAPVLTEITSQSILSDSTLTVIISMTNAKDTDGDSLTVIIDEGENYNVTGSSISVSKTFNGIISVFVRVSDGIDTTAAISMQVTVTRKNSKPVIVKTISFGMLESNSVNITFDHIQAKDADGDSLIILLESGDNYSVSGLRVTPDDGFTGILIVQARITDGIDTTAASDIIIKVKETGVNITPEFGEVDIPSIGKNDSLTIISSMIGASDNDDDSLLVLIGTGENYSAENSTIIPDKGFFGIIEVPLRITDGIDTSDVMIVDIEVIEIVIDFHKGQLEQGETFTIQLYPSVETVASNVVIYSERGENDNLVVHVFDYSGRKLVSRVANKTENEFKTTLNMSSSGPGKYLLNFTYSKDGAISTQTKRIINILQ